jgi:hypothetical protein
MIDFISASYALTSSRLPLAGSRGAIVSNSRLAKRVSLACASFSSISACADIGSNGEVSGFFSILFDGSVSRALAGKWSVLKASFEKSISSLTRKARVRIPSGSLKGCTGFGEDVANLSEDVANLSEDVANLSEDVANEWEDVANEWEDVAEFSGLEGCL